MGNPSAIFVQLLLFWLFWSKFGPKNSHKMSPRTIHDFRAILGQFCPFLPKIDQNFMGPDSFKSHKNDENKQKIVYSHNN